MELSPIIAVGNYEKHKTKRLKNYVYIANKHTSELFYFFYFVFKKCKTRKIRYCKVFRWIPNEEKKGPSHCYSISSEMLLVGLGALTGYKSFLD